MIQPSDWTIGWTHYFSPGIWNLVGNVCDMSPTCCHKISVLLVNFKNNMSLSDNWIFFLIHVLKPVCLSPAMIMHPHPLPCTNLLWWTVQYIFSSISTIPTWHQQRHHTLTKNTNQEQSHFSSSHNICLSPPACNMKIEKIDKKIALSQKWPWQRETLSSSLSIH